MRYGVDLKAVSVRAYGELLRGRNLLPGRRMLKEGLDENFRRIEGAGVVSAGDLLGCLSTPRKLSDFSAKTGIPEDYLTLLKREIGSLEPRPVPLADFPGIAEETVRRLAARGIATSKDFFERCGAPGEGAPEGVPAGEARELMCLCALVRINGVGAAAAKAFHEAGLRSAGEIAAMGAAELLERITRANAEKRYYQAKLGEKDMQFVIDSAGLLLSMEGR